MCQKITSNKISIIIDISIEKLSFMKNYFYNLFNQNKEIIKEDDIEDGFFNTNEKYFYKNNIFNYENDKNDKNDKDDKKIVYLYQDKEHKKQNILANQMEKGFIRKHLTYKNNNNNIKVKKSSNNSENIYIIDKII